MKALRDSLFLLIGLGFVAGSLYVVWDKPAPGKYQGTMATTQPLSEGPTLSIGTTTIAVEIADTEAERELGLSGRAELERGRGLLFIFDKPGLYGFWMKDMNFDIDIVWINESWHVVGVDAAVPANSYPQVFDPVAPVMYVLELPSGDAAALGIDTGSQVYFDARK